MLATMFKSVLFMSVTGSLSALLLLALKPLTKRFFHPNWQYYIWLPVLLVMILPFPFSALPAPDFSLPLPETGQTITFETATENPNAVNDAAPAQTENPTAPTETAAVSSISLSSLLTVGAVLWLAGVLLLLLKKLLSYTRMCRELQRHSEPGFAGEFLNPRTEVRKTPLLDSPILIGLFRPILYLPDIELTEPELHDILIHEMTHRKRRDLLYKWLAMIVRALHWFNPLVYLITRQIEEECEISCDYQATRNLTPQEQRHYMQTILRLITDTKPNQYPLTTYMAGGKKLLCRRFAMIQSNKKSRKGLFLISLAVALVLVTSTAFAASAIQNNLNGAAATTDTTAANTLYTNEELGISLQMPADWDHQYTAVSSDNTVTFYQTSIYEKYGQYYGMLFYLEYIPGTATPEQIEGTAGGRQIAKETADGTWILGYPTDLQFPFYTDETTGETYLYPEDEAAGQQYDQMASQIESMVQTGFTVHPVTNDLTADTVTADNTYRQLRYQNDSAASPAGDGWGYGHHYGGGRHHGQGYGHHAQHNGYCANPDCPYYESDHCPYL